MPATTTTPDTVSAITHFHVIESQVGCLPETDPYVSDAAELALDVFAHDLAEWSEANPNEADAANAAGAARAYCGCPGRDDDPGDGEALASLERGESICEIAGLREFEIQVCRERDCLKYCPADDCRTVASVADVDWCCWVCGARYVPWDDCPWLD